MERNGQRSAARWRERVERESFVCSTSRVGGVVEASSPRHTPRVGESSEGDRLAWAERQKRFTGGRETLSSRVRRALEGHIRDDHIVRFCRKGDFDSF
jgi:hypothetical protein